MRYTTRTRNGVTEHRTRGAGWMSVDAISHSLYLDIEQSKRDIAHALGSVNQWHAADDKCGACVCGHGVVWFKCLECGRNG